MADMTRTFISDIELRTAAVFTLSLSDELNFELFGSCNLYTIYELGWIISTTLITKESNEEDYIHGSSNWVLHLVYFIECNIYVRI